VRLNLGCGKRTFGEDWINVDLFDVPPEGVKYQKADISKRLPFDDESADVVFSCHVIEHLDPTDVEGILRDWIRVLKPGGQFIVECPNLVGAAALLTAAEYAESKDVLAAALLAIYGDPTYKGMEHRHKWGYTPKTLIAMLRRLGLDVVRQAPAEFKRREPRDMRIIGVKP